MCAGLPTPPRAGPEAGPSWGRPPSHPPSASGLWADSAGGSSRVRPRGQLEREVEDAGDVLGEAEAPLTPRHLGLGRAPGVPAPRPQIPAEHTRFLAERWLWQLLLK